MNISQKTRPGFFITLEGIEGTGKTTQAKLLAERLIKTGLDVIVTQEPGGTAIGQKIREILLMPEHGEMSFTAELLLYYADRAQHLAEKIIPALEEGLIVITDRFSDSTMAYQGYGRGIDIALISEIDAIAAGGVRPDLTLLFDLDAETGLCRNRDINKVDRLELETIDFHKRVRDGFKSIAKKDPARFRTIDASMPIEVVSEEAWKIVGAAIKKRGLL
jgi:dTMP kinase